MDPDWHLTNLAFYTANTSNETTANLVTSSFQITTNSTNWIQPLASCFATGEDVFRSPVIANSNSGVTHQQVRDYYANRVPLRQKDKVARELLWEWLDADQRDTYRSSGAFYVRPESGRCYLITESWVELIEVDFDTPKHESIMAFCFHPDRKFSVFDRMLTQKLWLETDEEAFLRGANVDEIWRWRDTEEGMLIRTERAKRIIQLAADGTPMQGQAVMDALDHLKDKEQQFLEEVGAIARQVETLAG